MKTLAGRKCLVTGAASGIGRATALAAAREGAGLVLTDLDAVGLQAAVDEIRVAGGTVLMARAFDVRDRDAVQAFAADVHAAHGSLDMIMNVAGIAIWGSVVTMKAEQWRKVIDVNLMGPIHVIEAFVPAMIAARRGGHLVNVASAAALFGLPWHGAYCASKFGLRGLSEVLRFDLARHRIDVTLVCPGAVRTGLVQTVVIEGIDQAHPAVVAMRDQFSRHAVTPERAARAILRGIARRRYLVFTSFDIWLGWWAQRFFPWPYEWLMHYANRRMHRMARIAPAPRGPS